MWLPFEKFHKSKHYYLINLLVYVMAIRLINLNNSYTYTCSLNFFWGGGNLDIYKQNRFTVDSLWGGGGGGVKVPGL